MPHILKGRLCGFVCDDCREPLGGVTVRVYRPVGADVARLAAAAIKNTLAILPDEAADAKADRLLGEATAGADGAFAVTLARGYDDGPVEVDVYCATVPRAKVERGAAPVQLSLTTLQPQWRQTPEGLVAPFDECLPARFWCAVLQRFGVWTICGRLTLCGSGLPVAGATVRAYDADWLQDDPLGHAVTDAGGRFLVSYTAADFQRTPLTPWVNLELVGGPDVYFTAELGGTKILDEGQAQGRAPGRQNVSRCFCVSLCVDPSHGVGPEAIPHWQQVEVFDIHPAPGAPGASFSVEGYAGDPATGAFYFGGGVALNGNCPLRHVATGNPLEYRFLVGEWTWSPPAEDPGAIPSVPPASLAPVTQVADTHVGYVFYTDALGNGRSAQVHVGPADVGADGWIRLDGKPVTVPMYDPPGATAVVPVSPANFLRTFALIALDSRAVTAIHPAKMSAPLPRDEAGRGLTAAEREPVRRYALRFEARDTVTLALAAADDLSSVVLDNSPVVAAVNLEELFVGGCTPVGAEIEQIHLLYTVDHPHLRSFAVKITKNDLATVVHPPPAYSGSPTVAMPSGAFTAGDFFFRGGAGGAHDGAFSGGVLVDVSADPYCAYVVWLDWSTRRYNDPGGSTQVAYCKVKECP